MPGRVQVVGGGVIGLACAWELSRNGHAVTLVAPAPGRDGASWVAAGMLAPVTEAQFGESALTALLLEGAAPLAGLRRRARGGGRARHRLRHDGHGDGRARCVRPRQPRRPPRLPALARPDAPTAAAPASAARLVPALSPALRGGIEVPGDHHVDNRALLGALVARAGGPASRSSRAAWRAARPRARARPGGRPPPRARTTSCWRPGPACPPSPASARPGSPPLRPVKGHILRLGPPARPAAGPLPLLARTVRGLVRGRSVYLVPRRDGSLVVGATVEERGADTAVQAGAVHELLCDARASSPGSTSSSCSRRPPACARPRPTTRRAIGWTGLDGVVAAVGHYRNGILLAPLTARRGRRPGRAPPGGAAHRGAGAGMSALTLRVNGEPVAGAAGCHHRRPRGAALDGRRCRGGGRRRRPLCHPALGVGHARPPAPGPWSRW